MHLEVETLGEFDAVVAKHGCLRGCVVQSLDLTERTDVLVRLDARNTLFLGCVIPQAVAETLVRRGATIFPRLPDVPFDAYRAHLYLADDLYAGWERGYAETFDARVFHWTRHEASDQLDGTLAQALHDHAMLDALADTLPETSHGVGIMGGHAAQRGTPLYRQAAQLGHRLAEAGHLVITGGGPGVMEAANLGASHPGSAADVDAACETLASVPDFHDEVDAWGRIAFAVRDAMPGHRLTLGVPTWWYGHEPPNVFATAIAKFFDNAIREDTLLALCGAGIVYVAGAAGTTQEIFQAATRSYYAADEAEVRPMILVGRDYWTKTLPAWPLLRALARGRLMEPHVHLVDTLAEVSEVLSASAS